MKRIIIVDDEPLARQSLRMALEKLSGVELVAECSNGYEAVEKVRRLKPDILCLDIQMPGLSGFDVLDALAEEAPPTIFVTAYDSFAVKAFEKQALDYLLKPVKVDRLEQAIARVDISSLEAQSKVVSEYQAASLPLQRIVLRDGNEVQVIPVEKISHFTAQGDFVEINTVNNSYLKYERLNHLEELLDKQIFIRVHRSHILNLEFLHKIETSESGSRNARLTTNVSIPISKSGYKLLMQVI